MDSPPMLRRLSEIMPAPISWFWIYRVPLGAISLLEGHPGLGKSAVAYDFAARCSTGRAMPGERDGAAPAGVVLLQSEDEPASVMRPRLEAAGADLNRIYVPDGGMKSLVLPEDIDVLDRIIVESKAKLLVADPWSSIIRGSVNSEQVVRRTLDPLANLAARHRIAVILVRHLNKQSAASYISGGAGSFAILAAARSALRIIPDPGVDDPNRRMIVHTKGNLSKAPAFAFAMRTQNEVVGIEWVGECPDFVAEDANEVRAERSKEFEAKIALYAILRDGPLPANEAYAAAARAGVARRTLERAKRALRVRSHRRGNGSDFCFWWELPTDSQFFRDQFDQDLERLADQLFHGIDKKDLP